MSNKETTDLLNRDSSSHSNEEQHIWRRVRNTLWWSLGQLVLLNIWGWSALVFFAALVAFLVHSVGVDYFSLSLLIAGVCWCLLVGAWTHQAFDRAFTGRYRAFFFGELLLCGGCVLMTVLAAQGAEYHLPMLGVIAAISTAATSHLMFQERWWEARGLRLHKETTPKA